MTVDKLGAHCHSPHVPTAGVACEVAMRVVPWYILSVMDTEFPPPSSAPVLFVFAIRNRTVHVPAPGVSGGVCSPTSKTAAVLAAPHAYVESSGYSEFMEV